MTRTWYEVRPVYRQEVLAVRTDFRDAEEDAKRFLNKEPLGEFAVFKVTALGTYKEGR